MNLTLMLVVFISLALGYAMALVLSKSRIELARSEAGASSRDQLVLAQTHIEHLEGDLRIQTDRLRDAESLLGTLRQELGLSREEGARLQALTTVLNEERNSSAQRGQALEISLADTEASRSVLNAQAATLQAQVESEIRMGVELEEQLSSLRRENQRITDLLASTQAESSSTQTKLAESQATLEARNQERTELLRAAHQQEQDLQSVRQALLEKSKAQASLEAEIEGIRETHAARLEAVAEAQARLADTFQALSADALQANNASFLQLARTQMEGGQAIAVQDFEARQQAITGLLQPVQTGLAAMQTQVQSLATDRATAEATLANQIQHLVQAQAGLQAETGKLATALRKPEVKGQWGELQLRNVIEFAGMTEHSDFELQGSLEAEDGKFRPDLLVHLPGGKRLAVDAKVTSRAYLEALEVEGQAREERLNAVASQVRAQVKNLGDKRYYDALPESPDFVVLFLPLEALFSTALQRDPELLNYALEQHVILASPTTLVALLKGAAYGWAQERIQANAEEIQKLGTQLLSRIVGIATHADALRKAILGSVQAFNGFAGSLESRVMVTAQNLQALGIRPATKRKARALGLRAPQSLNVDLSGMPKLGVQGAPPELDAEILDPEGEYDREDGDAEPA